MVVARDMPWGHIDSFAPTADQDELITSILQDQVAPLQSSLESVKRTAQVT